MAELIKRRPRLILPRFLVEGDSGAVSGGDDDGGMGGIMLPVIAFEQQLGPLVVAPPGDGGGGVGPFAGGPFCFLSDQGWVCFNNLGVSGQFNIKFVNIPGDPNLVSCNQLTPPPPSGDIHSTPVGNLVRNPLTGLVVGRLETQVAAAGIVPAGGANAPVLQALRTGYAYTEADALALVGALGGYVIADTITEGLTGTGAHRLYLGGQAQGSIGYFVAGFMNAIGCISSWLVNYTDFYDPITVPTIFGVPARTQHITAFVPDGFGGGSYLGNSSRVRVQFVAPGTTAVYFFDYLVTPDNGDPPYHLIRSDKLTVPAGIPQTLVQPFPTVTAATVYLDNWQILFNDEVSEDWSSYPAPDAVFSLGTSGGWDYPVYLGGGGTWDNFENFQSGSNINVYILTTGYWGPATLSSLNGLEAYDDFEGYAAGSVTILNRGSGWVTVGTTAPDNIYRAYDDFQSYAAGAIATLPASADLLNRWPAAGTFRVVTYTRAWDDFESYAAGVIINLPIPADPDNEWSGIGTFGF